MYLYPIGVESKGARKVLSLGVPWASSVGPTLHGGLISEWDKTNMWFPQKLVKQIRDLFSGAGLTFSKVVRKIGPWVVRRIAKDVSAEVATRSDIAAARFRAGRIDFESTCG